MRNRFVSAMPIEKRPHALSRRLVVEHAAHGVAGRQEGPVLFGQDRFHVGEGGVPSQGMKVGA